MNVKCALTNSNVDGLFQMILAVKQILKTLTLTLEICHEFYIVWERFTSIPGQIFRKGLTQGLGSKLRLLYLLGRLCLSVSGIYKNVKTSLRLTQGHNFETGRNRS